jgi:hypothetical protein
LRLRFSLSLLGLQSLHSLKQLLALKFLSFNILSALNNLHSKRGQLIFHFNCLVIHLPAVLLESLELDLQLLVLID